MIKYLSLFLFIFFTQSALASFVISERGPSAEGDEQTVEEEYDPELDSDTEEYVDEKYDPELDGGSDEYIEEEYDAELDGDRGDYQSEVESQFDAQTFADGDEDQEIVEESFAGESLSEDEEDRVREQSNLVEKEYYQYNVTTDINKVLQPYKYRRSNWGFAVGVGYSLYDPINYQPNFQPTLKFVDLYRSSGMVEINLQLQRHLSFGTVALALNTGLYSTENFNPSIDGNKLTVIPVRLEGNFVLDTIFDEPLVAPYGIFGVYSNVFKEVQAGVSFNGNTAVAMYYGIGVNLQLNWLEPETAVRSYINHGIENTFVFIEGKQYLSSAPETDPDFGTSFILASGIRLEY